jgi:hypothetical protein
MDTNNAVFEYTEFASENYRGTRFISSNPEKGSKLPKNLKLIAQDLTTEDAKALCNVTREKNYKAFENSLPLELRETFNNIIL